MNGFAIWRNGKVKNPNDFPVAFGGYLDLARA
jgi:hypothetical protein